MQRDQWQSTYRLARAIYGQPDGHKTLRRRLATCAASVCVLARWRRVMPPRTMLEAWALWLSMMENQPHWRRSSEKRREIREFIRDQIRANAARA